MTSLARGTRDHTRSLLAHEWEVFLAQLRDFRDSTINAIFALTFQRAEWRGRTLTLLFLVILGLITLQAHSLSEWAEHIRNVFIFLLNPAVAQTFPTNPITDLLRFSLDAWPYVLRDLPVFMLPFLIALHNAACYLADIFEKPVQLGRRFIWEVALGGTSETAVIQEGEFINRDDSLIYSIGGPGYVRVDLDSAALFESPDGTPHIVGPTVTGRHRLAGFERFRQAIDLREQQLRLDDIGEISERTQDGIVVRAANVQVRFSVLRGSQRRTLRQPNPFAGDDVIRSLIYEERRTVGRSETEIDGSPRYHNRNMTLPITSVLRAEFKRFIRERRLSQFLASHSEPEMRHVRQLRADVEAERRRLLPDQPAPDLPALDERPPAFLPRPELAALMKDQLRPLCRARGVDLIWIDVGTWKTSAEIVPENHLDAWRISSRNAMEGTSRAMERHARQVYIDKILKMIRDVPIERHEKVWRTKSMKHLEKIAAIVTGYREQLIDARQILEEELERGGDQPQTRRHIATLKEALAHIEEILRISRGGHWLHF